MHRLKSNVFSGCCQYVYLDHIKGLNFFLLVTCILFMHLNILVCNKDITNHGNVFSMQRMQGQNVYKSEREQQVFKDQIFTANLARLNLESFEEK